MIDVEKLKSKKEDILKSLRLKGPSLPVRIAGEIGVEPLFAAAFLSDLKAENKVRISNMKVGSSPIYFLPGQEPSLERFIEHLNQREREAFLLLKEKRVLSDEKQEPVVRVALRALKDFAFPVKVRINGESKLFWKFFSVSDAEASGIISREVSALPAVLRVDKQLSFQKQEKTVEAKKEKKEIVRGEKKVEQLEVKEKIRQPTARKQIETEFSKKVKDYLKGKDVELLEVFSERKKEFEGKIRIDTLFGKQEFYFVAKDKKIITDNDFAVALQKANSKKILAAVMTTGEVNKKGKEHLEEWGNLVKFERLNF